MSDTSTSGAAARKAEGPANKRAFFRWTFKGTAFPCRTGKKRFDIRLKDLSCGGACGLMEEPVAIGDYVMIAFDDRHVVEAQVCWVRRVMVGVSFANSLTPSFVTRIHERACAPAPKEDDDDYVMVPRTRVRKI